MKPALISSCCFRNLAIKVALRVTDNALQSAIDTVTVNLAKGNPPIAMAGNDMDVVGRKPFYT